MKNFTKTSYRQLCCLLVIVTCCCSPAAYSRSGGNGTPTVKAAENLVRESSEKSGFTENKGQLLNQDGKANQEVKYLLHMPGLNVQLRQTGFSYDAWIAENAGTNELSGEKRRYHRVDVELEGANPSATLVAEQPVNGISNYIGVGSGIREFRKVTYRDIYPGIDLEFIAERVADKPVEYNFIVHPGADAAQIRMKYNTDADIALQNGEISMKLDFGTLNEKIPASYTQGDGHSLAVQYKSLSETDNLFAFQVPDYDRGKTLVIDPTPNIVWATYLGGISSDYVTGLDVDAGGNIYACGYSSSTANIATAGTYRSAASGFNNSILVKYNAAGVRIWGTYYGNTLNSGTNYGSAVKVSGNAVYMCGSAASNLGPSTPNGYQTTPGGAGDGYVLSLATADGTRNWDTYYGSNGYDFFLDLAIAPNGDIIAAGGTEATSATTQSAIATAGTIQPTLTVPSGTISSGMLVSFSPTGARNWGTYFGSAANVKNLFIGGVDIDAGGNIFIAGQIINAAGNVPVTAGALQTVRGGSADGYIAKINSSATVVNWCSYLGGSGSDGITAVRVDHAGNVIVGGQVASASGIASPGAYQATFGGGTDIVLAKFNTLGALQWSTYYGGSASDNLTIGFPIYYVGHGLDIDESNNILFFGNSGTNLSTSCSYNPSSAAGIIGKFDPAGSRIWASHYAVNLATSLLYLGNSAFLVAGSTANTTLGTSGTQQPTYTAGGAEGIIAKFNDGTLPAGIAVSASLLSPVSQSVCNLGIPQTIIGNTVIVSTPADFNGAVLYQWQRATSASGPWTDMAGETFKDFSPPAGNVSYSYRRLVKLNGDYCNLYVIDSSAASAVSINAFSAPTAQADGPTWYACTGTPVTLNGSGTPGPGATSITDYSWYTGSNTTASAATATFTPTVSASTTYTLKVTDNNGCSAIDQVTVIPTAANAGPAVNYCSGSAGVQIGTTPLASPDVTYSWSPATGLSCTTCAQPVANPAATTTYTLTASVLTKTGAICNTTSTVTVTVIAPPGANFAGPDQTICKGSTSVIGNAAVSGYTYAWSPATYLNNTAIAQPTFDAGLDDITCGVAYTLTASKGGCNFYDNMIMSVIDQELNYTGTVTGPTWVSGKHNSNNCSGTTYAWNVVSGPGSVMSTRNGGADALLQTTTGSSTVFTRTTTLNGVSCTSAPVTIIPPASSAGGSCTVDIILKSGPGCPKVFGVNPIQLGSANINVSDYKFHWSPGNIMDDSTASVVNIYNTAPAIISLTVTSKYDSTIQCTDTFAINAPSLSLPVFALTDKYTCPGTPVSVGLPAVTGYLYAWTPAGGLSNTTVSNPTATLVSDANYTAVVTDAATGCYTSSTMNVDVNAVNYNAGPDRAICAGGIVTLGPNSSPANYTYSWVPVLAAYQNGTDASSANPQVLFGGADQMFTVTVTDTASGCSIMDSVTLSSSVSTNTYSGVAPTPICPGSSTTIGTAAFPGASYTWSPSATLSCSTCAQPVASPAANTTYTVSVSYPGCSAPLTDTVTVKVYTPPVHNFPDVGYCPATGIAIGGTVAGVNSYSWAPSANLSCTNCPSPVTNSPTMSTYTATLTYGNGCTDTDQVVATPKFIASAKPDATICLGSSAVLGLPAVADVTYSWSPSTYLSATNVAQPTATPTIAGSFNYTLTVTGTGPNAGCTTTDVMTLKVNQPTVPTITGSTTICSGNSTTLSTPAVSGNYLYQWVPGTGVASPNNSSTLVTPATSTQYKVVRTDLSTGCSSSDQVTVTVNPNPIALIGDTVRTCNNLGGTVLPLTANGSYTYSWTPAGNLSSAFVQNPTTYSTSTTTYTVMATDNTSNCQRAASSVLKAGVCSYTLSGNVYRDANGYTDSYVNANGSVSAVPTGMYVSLVDASDNVMATQAVPLYGAYSFSSVIPGTYRIVLQSSSSGSSNPILPAGFMSTGANLGAGPGGGGNTLGVLPAITVVASDVTEANIAIQQRPAVTDQHETISAAPALNTYVTLNDTVQAISGSDAEDQPGYGPLNNQKVLILSLPVHGELWYNGALISLGADGINPPSASNPFVLAGYNPALLQFKKSGLGYSSTSFGFAYMDASGTASAPATYYLSWPTPLPVVLSYFNAVKKDNTAALDWKVSSSYNTDVFFVERSQDAISWNTIGQVDAINDMQHTHSYMFDDVSPENGANYYRLRITDFSGEFTNSDVRKLSFDGIRTEREIRLAPNPAREKAILQFTTPITEEATIQLVNQTGQIIATYDLNAGTSRFALNLKGVSAGVYYVIVLSDEVKQQLKLVIEQ